MKYSNELSNNSDIEGSMSVNAQTISYITGQVDEVTKKIFRSNAIGLLSEPVANIVEAVWGISSEKSRLTSAQLEIDSAIRPVIREIKNVLEAENLDGTKHKAIDCLIKKLAISQLIFMVEHLKLVLVNGDISKSTNGCSLADMEVAGHA
jgi:hypothetical protein